MHINQGKMDIFDFSCLFIYFQEFLPITVQFRTAKVYILFIFCQIFIQYLQKIISPNVPAVTDVFCAR